MDKIIGYTLIHLFYLLLSLFILFCKIAISNYYITTFKHKFPLGGLAGGRTRVHIIYFRALLSCLYYTIDCVERLQAWGDGLAPPALRLYC